MHFCMQTGKICRLVIAFFHGLMNFARSFWVVFRQVSFDDFFLPSITKFLTSGSLWRPTQHLKNGKNILQFYENVFLYFLPRNLTKYRYIWMKGSLSSFTTKYLNLNGVFGGLQARQKRPGLRQKMRNFVRFTFHTGLFLVWGLYLYLYAVF